MTQAKIECYIKVNQTEFEIHTGGHDHTECRSEQGTKQPYNKGCWIQSVHRKVSYNKKRGHQRCGRGNGLKYFSKTVK
jgi:hypothetical protein